MAIIFSMNENGKVTIYPYGITNGINTVPCKSEDYANNLLGNRRYEGYAIIESDEPSEKLLETLKGVRFDSLADAENFINGDGYKESVNIKVSDLEQQMTDTQLALVEVYEMMI